MLQAKINTQSRNLPRAVAARGFCVWAWADTWRGSRERGRRQGGPWAFISSGPLSHFNCRSHSDKLISLTPGAASWTTPAPGDQTTARASLLPGSGPRDLFTLHRMDHGGGKSRLLVCYPYLRGLCLRISSWENAWALDWPDIWGCL